MARSDPGTLFDTDGRKLHDTERVGAMTPDTDPAEEPGRPPDAAARHRPRSPG
jgi:hypothetical protein